jgi:peptide deformylase
VLLIISFAHLFNVLPNGLNRGIYLNEKKTGLDKAKHGINPEMTILESKPKYDYESCVPVPFCSGLVKRANVVELKALDEDIKNIELKCAGFWARIVQHEIDRLDGFILVDRMEEVAET